MCKFSLFGCFSWYRIYINIRWTSFYSITGFRKLNFFYNTSATCHENLNYRHLFLSSFYFWWCIIYPIVFAGGTTWHNLFSMYIIYENFNGFLKRLELQKLKKMFIISFLFHLTHHKILLTVMPIWIC